jgi:uncharacterized protein YndB with AHSA1/START domain
MKRYVVVMGLLAMCGGARRLTADEPSAVSFVNEGVVSAPIEQVWRVWSTSDGYKALGVALADVDLRVGGLIRSRYGADGVLGDEQTIENEILAYEPPRMIAIRIHKTPANFPFKDAWKHTWTVVTLTPLADGRTHVRGASLGYGADTESVAMRRFFERGNQQTIDALIAHFAHGR